MSLEQLLAGHGRFLKTCWPAHEERR